MKAFKIEGKIFQESGESISERESEELFNEFIKFLEDKDYTFNGQTNIE